MLNISSETIFHFTTLENLKGILASGFYPRYSVETLLFEDKVPLETAYPMVCFCDIPLSQVKQHLTTYGNYGIGMSRKWACDYRLNPVMYLKTGARLSEWLLRMVENCAKLSAAEDPFVREFKAGLLFMLRHIKPFEGRSDKTGTWVKFYDEREWRYIPYLFRDKDGKQSFPETLIKKEELSNPELIQKKNAEMENFALGFHPDDIKYIIVKTEAERLGMVSFLRQVKTEHYHYEEAIVNVLTSRIISSEQIRSDF